MSVANAEPIRSTPQPVSVGFAENPYPGSDGATTWNASDASPPNAVGSVSGSITFGLPEFERNVTLFPGDRLDLPKGILHDALVGKDGVVCLEGHH